MSIRNRKITSLLYLREEGRLPANIQDLEWIASNIKRFTGHILGEHYSLNECKEISSILLNKMFPDIRIIPGMNIEQKQQQLDAMPKQITDGIRHTHRAVPALRQKRIKRTVSL